MSKFQELLEEFNYRDYDKLSSSNQDQIIRYNDKINELKKEIEKIKEEKRKFLESHLGIKSKG